MKDALAQLPNIGDVLAGQLHEADIDTAEALRDAGAKEVWLRILAFDDSACIHRLLALEGAVQNMPKSQLPEDTKKDLRAFYRQAKGE